MSRPSDSIALMPRASLSSATLRSPKRRLVIWACFLGATTGASGILLLGDRGAPRALPAVSPQLVSMVAPSAQQYASLVTPRERPVVPGAWSSIVVHHSATLAGDAQSLERQHLAAGLSGLGYHFVIGNGQGLGDGVVHTGYRWNRQLPGAHVASTAGHSATLGLTKASLSPSDADHYNRHSIGVCLVGNGNRREFTDRQMRELLWLVRELQTQFGIPASRVHLHSDLAAIDSPGQFFPTAEFEAQIRR
ncbi:MAG: N-acetylmuramoyl-L-alanine amidase [Phycisphaerales bacterium]|nr:N-acetylmuramoyl-L-alanine amidase [Phycisphaerales bacterium]